MLNHIEFADDIERQLQDQKPNTDMCIKPEAMKKATGRTQLKKAFVKNVAEELENRGISNTVLPNGRMKIPTPERKTVPFNS